MQTRLESVHVFSEALQDGVEASLHLLGPAPRENDVEEAEPHPHHVDSDIRLFGEKIHTEQNDADDEGEEDSHNKPSQIRFFHDRS